MKGRVIIRSEDDSIPIGMTAIQWLLQSQGAVFVRENNSSKVAHERRERNEVATSKFPWLYSQVHISNAGHLCLRSFLLKSYPQLDLTFQKGIARISSLAMRKEDITVLLIVVSHPAQAMSFSAIIPEQLLPSSSQTFLGCVPDETITSATSGFIAQAQKAPREGRG